jgi:hypothetical protein
MITHHEHLLEIPTWISPETQLALSVQLASGLLANPGLTTDRHSDTAAYQMPLE